jgi:hypothetical protein
VRRSLRLCGLVSQATAKEDNRVEVLYDVLFPYLADGTLLSAFEQSEGHGDLASTQRAGTCYYRCVLALLRFLLQRDGVGMLQRKQVFFALRVAFIERAQADLAAITELSIVSSVCCASPHRRCRTVVLPSAILSAMDVDATPWVQCSCWLPSLSATPVACVPVSAATIARVAVRRARLRVLRQSEARILHLGRQQTALAASKESARGNMSPARLEAVLHRLTAFLQQVDSIPRPSDEQEAEAPPLLDMTDADTLLSFPGLRFVSDNRSTDQFAGAARGVSRCAVVGSHRLLGTDAVRASTLTITPWLVSSHTWQVVPAKPSLTCSPTCWTSARSHWARSCRSPPRRASCRSSRGTATFCVRRARYRSTPPRCCRFAPTSSACSCSGCPLRRRGPRSALM